MFAAAKRYISDLGRLTPIGIVSMFLPILGSSLLLVFILPVGHWLRENWQAGLPLFLVSVLVFCGLALLPTNVIGLVSGWAFSFELGLLVLITGIVGASVISFLIYSRISGDMLPETLKNHPRSLAIYRSLLQDEWRKTVMIVFLVRVSVIMPFAFTNFVLAASRVPLGIYIFSTAAGMLPRAAATAWIGSGMYELDINNARDTSVFIVGLAATVVSVIVIGIISRRALDHVTREHRNADLAET